MKCLILAVVLLGAAYAIEAELATEAARSPGQLLVDHINSLILSVKLFFFAMYTNLGQK